MNREYYKYIYDRLNSIEDIAVLMRETALDRETLLVIYTHKMTRRATRMYYVVKKHSTELLYQWRKGKSFVRLAERWRFPPVLMAQIIMRVQGMTRKEIWNAISYPGSVADKRLKRELFEVLEKDIVYSPQGLEIQYARGRAGERKLQAWLDAQNILYKTECEQRKTLAGKTPDYLLQSPLRFAGIDIYWFESKATFGDYVEVRKNLRRQLLPYTEIFGSGIVIYWFGIIDDIKQPNDVFIVDGSFIKMHSVNPRTHELIKTL